MRRGPPFSALVGVGFLALWASVDAAPAPAPLSPQLQQVRSALDRYQDPILAVQDGYFSTLGCLEYPNGPKPGAAPYPPGGMGIHFLNPALISPNPDPFHPPVLVYEPDGKKLRLVAAEWFVPLSTGVKGTPQLFGHAFDGPMAGHFPVMPKSMTHYDLHVWLWKPNPAGLFSGTNPDVKCTDAAYAFREEAPAILK